MKTAHKIVFAILIGGGVLITALGMSAAVGWMFSVCWNVLMVPLARAPSMDWWQGWAATFLLGCATHGFRLAVTRESHD